MKFHRISLRRLPGRLWLAAMLGLLYALGGEGVRAGVQATHMVTFSCCSYSPATLFISAGDEVNWQGNFNAHPLASDDGLWPTQSAGDSFSFTFQHAGVFRYYCTIHGGPGGASMSGQVIVSGPFTAYMPLIVK